MNRSSTLILYTLIRSAIQDPLKEKLFKDIGIQEFLPWEEVYRMAAEQGVLAVAWDGLIRLVDVGVLSPKQLPERGLKIRWAINAEQIEKRYWKQEQIAHSLAAAMDASGIRMHVLKGLAISGYYPHPEHRECGDLDCFLDLLPQGHVTHPEGAYEAGNLLAKELGAKVEKEYYKHSHILYRGLMIENHQFCTAIRGRRERKEFERHLQGLIAKSEPQYINSSKLIRPSADFNALFLTAHSFQHFLSEGIKLRHILDWALLLKAEQDQINWSEFYTWCDRMHFSRFVHTVTAIAVEEFGIKIHCPEIVTISPYKKRVLEDTIYYGRAIFNTKESVIKKRWMLTRNRLQNRWKYQELYDRSSIIDLLIMIWAFIIERKPFLN